MFDVGFFAETMPFRARTTITAGCGFAIGLNFLQGSSVLRCWEEQPFHVVLRSRPDAVSEWSDAEVAKRWWSLFPSRRDEDGTAAEPTEFELNAIVNDKVKLAEIRKRLGSISWFMRCTSEVIARRANAEEECTGRFWEGRFKATVLDSDEAVAACMAYVDLNPVRAGLAKSVEDSDFTSAKERVSDVMASEEV